jgi:hypothetical protein
MTNESPTVNQKADILQSLGRLEILRRSGNNWYCAVPRISISDGEFLVGPFGDGNTPIEALEALSDQLTILPPNKYVVRSNHDGTRDTFRWNGWMWDTLKP